MHRFGRFVSVVLLALVAPAIAEEASPRQKFERASEEWRAAKDAYDAALARVYEAVAAFKARLDALHIPYNDPAGRKDDGITFDFGPKDEDGHRRAFSFPHRAFEKGKSAKKGERSTSDLYQDAHDAQREFEKAERALDQATRKLDQAREAYERARRDGTEGPGLPTTEDGGDSSVIPGQDESVVPGADDGAVEEGPSLELPPSLEEITGRATSTADFLDRLQLAIDTLREEAADLSLRLGDLSAGTMQTLAANSLQDLLDAARRLDGIGDRLSGLSVELGDADGARRHEIRLEVIDLQFQIEGIVAEANATLSNDALLGALGVLERFGLNPYLGGSESWFTRRGAELLAQSEGLLDATAASGASGETEAGSTSALGR